MYREISGKEAWIEKSKGNSVQWRLIGLDWQELTDKEFLNWDNSRFVGEESNYFFRIVEDNKMLGNYKIKVNNESESKEAQELFFELGYQWYKEDKGVFWETTSGFIFANGISMILMGGVFMGTDAYAPLTLPQLRDMVAAHRKPTELSGADALRALADGKEVEGFLEENEKWIPIVYFSVQEVVNGLYKFRLKPRTITLNVEIPAPFEPKVGEEYWFVSTQDKGYGCNDFESNKYDGRFMNIGAWRTEEEIKLVVAALRGALK